MEAQSREGGGRLKHPVVKFKESLRDGFCCWVLLPEKGAAHHGTGTVSSPQLQGLNARIKLLWGVIRSAGARLHRDRGTGINTQHKTASCL